MYKMISTKIIFRGLIQGEIVSFLPKSYAINFKLEAGRVRAKEVQLVAAIHSKC